MASYQLIVGPYWGNVTGPATGRCVEYVDLASLEPGLTESLWVFDWGTFFLD